MLKNNHEFGINHDPQGAVAMDDWTVYRVTGVALDNLAAKFSKSLE